VESVLSRREPEETRGVRLRPLSEAECYARCYGSRDERVSVVARDERSSSIVASRLRELVEQRLAERTDQPGLEAA
jgi:hypothetical protein